MSRALDSDDVTAKQLNKSCANACRRSNRHKKRQISTDTIAVRAAPICVEQPKQQKRLVDSSRGRGQGNSGPVYPCKNRGNARKCQTRKDVVRVIDVSDSEDSLPLGEVEGQPKRSMDSGNSIRPKGLLDSKIFACYMEHIWMQFPKRKRNSFTLMDSMWFNLYAESEGKEKVLGWIKSLNLFSKKYVLVPIVIWSHWNLLILCHFGENLQSKTTTPCMLLLDSLQTLNPLRLEPLIRKFVMDIFIEEKRPEDKKLIRKIPLLIPKVPQQIDDKMCGYFALHYISLFMKDAPKDFSIHKGYPYFMKEDWFTLEAFDKFCTSLDSASVDE